MGKIRQEEEEKKNEKILIEREKGRMKKTIKIIRVR